MYYSAKLVGREMEVIQTSMQNTEGHDTVKSSHSLLLGPHRAISTIYRILGME